MNTFEDTAQELKRQSELPKIIGKKALSLGSAALGASSFAPVLSKAAPFLSKYIPENLAIKGLSKVNKGFGRFINDALNQGFGFDQIKEFIGGKIEESRDSEREDNNIIKKNYPDLHEFIIGEMKKGRNTDQAASLAQLGAEKNSSFRNAIKKLTNESKIPWSQIVKSIYENYKSDESEENKTFEDTGMQQENNPSEMMGFDDETEEDPSIYENQNQSNFTNNQANNFTNNNSQPGPGEQRLMSFLQKVQKARGL